MSIIMKSMKAGTVSIDEFSSYAELLPVMIHIHDQHLPYYIIEDGKMVFQGNVRYLDAQKNHGINYTLKIKNEDGSVSSETFHDIVAISVAAGTANDASLPWFIMDNNTNKVIRKGNCDQLQPTPAPKAGVAPMPEPETPDIDIDAALDEMNNVIGDNDKCVEEASGSSGFSGISVVDALNGLIDKRKEDLMRLKELEARLMSDDALIETDSIIGDMDAIDSIEKPVSEQPVEESVNLDLIEDAAFLDQDPDGLYHIVRVDNRILDGYMDLRYATKEKAVRHFSELNKAHVAMITFSLVENINNFGDNHVTVRSFNFNKANKDYTLNAIFHFFSLMESRTRYYIDLSPELEKILDAFLKSFKPEDGVFFDGEPLEILVDNHKYYIQDEYQRNDAMMVSVYGGSEKEEWRYLYNSKEAIASEDVLYSVCIASGM